MLIVKNGILIGIGKYLLGLGIMTMGCASIFRGMTLTSNIGIFMALLVLVPLILALTKGFWRGLIYMLTTALCLNAILPIMGLSYGKPYPVFFSFDEERNAREEFETGIKKSPTNSIEGRYTGNIGGAVATMIVGSDSWYGEHREESTGEILGSSAGTMEGSNVIDEYGNRIGYVRNGYANVTIAGESVSLQRE